MIKWLARHRVWAAVFYMVASCLATLFAVHYTNSYDDHVEKQKEFIVLQNMQEDFTEMKTLLKTNNDMMTSLMQDNVANKTLTGQLNVRMTNAEERLSTMERVIYERKK